MPKNLELDTIKLFFYFLTGLYLFVYFYDLGFHSTLLLLPGIIILARCLLLNITDPRFMLFPVSLYYLINTLYLDANGISLSYTYVLLFYTTLLILNFFIEGRDFNLSNATSKATFFSTSKTIKIFIFFNVIYLLCIYISFGGEKGVIATIFRVMLISTVEVVLYCLIFLLYSKRYVYGLYATFVYGFSVPFRLFLDSNFNRASILYIVLIAFFGVYIYLWKRTKVPLLLSILFLLLIYIFTSNVDVKQSFVWGNSYGGDSLIVYSANEIINFFDKNQYAEYEPLMTIHNYFMLMIPDNFLFLYDKPVAYNPSAWYITNILGLDPTEYKWGIGVSLIGSGYIYGGLLGVVLVCFLVVIFINCMTKKISNPLYTGLALYFSIRLPYAVFRMDENFLLPLIIFNSFSILFILTILEKAISNKEDG